MGNRRATITQTEIARIIRAAKQAGAAEVELKVGDHLIRVRFSPSATEAAPIEEDFSL